MYMTDSSLRGETAESGVRTRRAAAGNAAHGFAVGAAALFMAGFLLLVVFGAQGYRAAAGGQRSNAERRAHLSHIAAAVKSLDAAGAVDIFDGPQGQGLEVRDGYGYSFKIYLYDGELVEEYSAEGQQPEPREAQSLGRSGKFEIVRDGDLLNISTDAGELRLTLRCAEA